MELLLAFWLSSMELGLRLSFTCECGITDLKAKQTFGGTCHPGLGADHGRKALKAFETLCSLCSQHGRRQLMLHEITCKCIGSDESCFANFIATAATGEREDAMLISTLLVRADIGPIITSLAADFGLALVRMNLSSPKDLDDVKSSGRSHLTTFH